MATVFIDGFETYATGVFSQANGSNDYVSIRSDPIIQTTLPRNGTRCVRMLDDAAFRILPESVSLTTFSFHVAIANRNVAVVSNLDATASLTGFGLGVGGNATGTSCLRVVPLQGGTFGLYRDTTLLSTSVAFPQDTYVSHDVTYNGTTGAWSWQINGAQFDSGTTTTGSGFDRIFFGADDPEFVMDDIFVRDDAVHVGDIFVPYIFPDADTADADWVLSTGGTGYTLIDEVGPNDSDHIQAAAINDTSTFGLSNVTETLGLVYSVGVKWRSLKTDAGTAAARANVISNAVTGNGTTRVLTQSPVQYDEYFDLNPDGSVAWTQSTVDALQVQFERTA